MQRKWLAYGAAALILGASGVVHGQDLAPTSAAAPVVLSDLDLDRVTAAGDGVPCLGCFDPPSDIDGKDVAGAAKNGDGPGYAYDVLGNDDPRDWFRD